MKYSILHNGREIACFEFKEDALHFLEWKREKALMNMNTSILDKIAEENSLDRRYPGLFPSSVTFPYYEKAKAQIETEITMKER